MSLYPLYTFRCPECRYVRDVRMPMADLDVAEPVCPFDGHGMRKIITAPAGIFFKGPGFACTDSRPNPNEGRNPNNRG